MIKRNDRVRVLRPESYWMNQIGNVVAVDQGKVNYPVLVRFETVNYTGTNTNNYNLDEICLVKDE